MKIKSILFIVALASITSAYADEYVCKVYCENTSGPKEYVTVKADSASEAAKIVGKEKAEAMVEEIPKAILDDGGIPDWGEPENPTKPKRKPY